MILLEVFGDQVASEIAVEVTPREWTTIPAPVVELDEVLLRLDPEVRDGLAGPAK